MTNIIFEYALVEFATRLLISQNNDMYYESYSIWNMSRESRLWQFGIIWCVLVCSQIRSEWMGTVATLSICLGTSATFFPLHCH
jgi:hypothetical protein